MSAETIIQVQDLSYFTNNNFILENINFNISKGDYIGLIGPNGGGKTTLVKALVGLVTPSKGRVIIRDAVKIGYVPQRISQNINIFPATISEIVQSGSLKATKSDILKVLKITKITHLKDRLIYQVSGGELQKVMIARALIAEPQLLILDEPIVGVDTPSQNEFYQFLKTLNQENNITILFVSHDLDVITNQANRILCINKTLTCHHCSESLLNDSHIKSVFGTDKKLITPHHHHSHA